MLVEKAIAYEATSYRGLYHFIRYIESLKRYEVDYGEASLGTESDLSLIHIYLLWRPELALLQEWNGMPKYKWQSKAFVREKILERIPEETLKHQITGLLFERDYEELLAQIREVQKTTRPRRRNMSEQRRAIKAVRKKRSAAKKRAGS